MPNPVHRRSSAAANRRSWPIWLALAATAIALAVFLRPSSPPRPASSATNALAAPPSASGHAANPAFRSLVGRWLREDGGYILEVSSVEAEGKLRASYFNPNPIHVSKALAVWENETVKAFVELNDVNYPGCLYTLAFESKEDRLVGTYFQAALQQTFDVVFVRQP